MNEYSEIKKSIRRICRVDDDAKRPLLFVAEVVAVRDDARTCDVIVDGLKRAGVRLRAPSSGGDDQMLVVPRLGSDVIVADLAGDGSYLAVVGTTEIEAVKMAAGGESLAKVLSDFIDETARIIVVQGTSPNVPALQQIKLRLNKILK